MKCLFYSSFKNATAISVILFSGIDIRDMSHFYNAHSSYRDFPAESPSKFGKKNNAVYFVFVLFSAFLQKCP